MLPRAHRLTDPESFRGVIRTGTRAAGPLVVVHVSGSGDSVSRVGLVVGKAVGNSVTRSLVSRRLRHIMREQLGSLPMGSSVVIRALPAAGGSSYRELADEVERCLSRAVQRLPRAPNRPGT